MKRIKSTLWIMGALILWVVSIQASTSEKYFTRNGYVKFFSDAAMENIEAENFKVTSVLDASSGRIEFAVLIKAFEFEKALMEEHFNENYMESSQFPKATFKGKLDGFSLGRMAPGKSQTVKAVGDLTIHGVTQKVNIPGKITMGEEEVKVNATFSVSPEDYNIEIPKTVRENIAKSIEVTVDMTLKPF